MPLARARNMHLPSGLILMMRKSCRTPFVSSALCKRHNAEGLSHTVRCTCFAHVGSDACVCAAVLEQIQVSAGQVFHLPWKHNWQPEARPHFATLKRATGFGRCSCCCCRCRCWNAELMEAMRLALQGCGRHRWKLSLPVQRKQLRHSDVDRGCAHRNFSLLWALTSK